MEKRTKILNRLDEEQARYGLLSEDICKDVYEGECSASKISGYIQRIHDIKYRRIALVVDLIECLINDEGYKLVDVGDGAELEYHCSRNDLDMAVRRIIEKGYKKVYINIPKVGNADEYITATCIGPDTTVPEQFVHVD